MSSQGEWLADLADACDALGLGIRSVGPNAIVVYQGSDVTITVESHFLSGRMLRSLLKPRPDPMMVETDTRPAA